MNVSGSVVFCIPLRSGGYLYRIGAGEDMYVSVLSMDRLPTASPIHLRRLSCKSVVHRGQKRSLLFFRAPDSSSMAAMPSDSRSDIQDGVRRKFVHSLSEDTVQMAVGEVGGTVDGMAQAQDGTWVPEGPTPGRFWGHRLVGHRLQMAVPCAFCCCSGQPDQAVVVRWMVKQKAKECMADTLGPSAISLLDVPSCQTGRRRYSIYEALFEQKKCPCLQAVEGYLGLFEDSSRTMMCMLDRNLTAITDQASVQAAVPNISHESVVILRDVKTFGSLLVTNQSEVLLQFDRPLAHVSAVGQSHFDCVHSLAAGSTKYDAVVSVRGMAGWRVDAGGRPAMVLIDSFNRIDTVQFCYPGGTDGGVILLGDQLAVVSELLVSEAVLRRTRDGQAILIAAPDRTKVANVYRASVMPAMSSRNCYYLDEIKPSIRACVVRIRVMVVRVLFGGFDWRRIVQVCDAKGSMRVVVEGPMAAELLPRPFSKWISVTCSVLADSALYLHSIDAFSVARHSMVLLDILEQRRT